MNLATPSRGTRESHGSASLLVLLALGLIAIVSLPPSSASLPGGLDLCLVCGDVGAASLLLNVILYVPLGAALRLRGAQLVTVVAIGAAVSVGIESTQLVIPGRHTALSDLLANTLGAALGGVLALQPRRWLMPSGASGRVATAITVVTACATLLLGGLLLRPTAPAGEYYGQWRPGSSVGRPYDGMILEARIGDLPLPSSRLEDSDRARELLREGAPVRVRFVVGSTDPHPRTVFRVVAGPHGSGAEVLELGVAGTTLVLSQRLLADDYRFPHPHLHLERALERLARGDTVTVEWQPRRDRGFLAHVDRQPALLLGFTVGRSWNLLYPATLRSEALLRLFDHAWVLLIAAPIGWYATRGVALSVSLAAVIAAAELAPRASLLLLTPLSIHAAILVGFLLGGGARRGIQRLQRRVGAQTS